MIRLFIAVLLSFSWVASASVTLNSVPSYLLNSVLSFNQSLASRTACDVQGAVPDPGVPAWVELVQTCPGEDEFLRAHFLKTLGEVRSMGALIAAPQKLSVNPCSSSTAYEPSKQLLHFRTRWDEYDTGMPMDVKYALGVVAHEYGHAVLDAGTQSDDRFRIWRTYYADRNSIARNVDDLQNKIRKESDLPLRGGYPDWDVVRKTHSDLDEAYSLLEKSSKMNVIQNGYNELFADLVAAIYSSDPEIISTALHTEKQAGNLKRLSQNRSFARIVDRGPQSQWHWDISQWLGEWHVAVSYALLAPSRNAIWKSFQGKIVSAEQKQRMVKKIFEMLILDFQENFASYDALNSLNVTALNDRLIAQFEKSSGLIIPGL